MNGDSKGYAESRQGGSSVWNVQRVHNALEIPNGEELAKERVTGNVVGLTLYGRRVIGPHGAFKTCLVIGAQHSLHRRLETATQEIQEVHCPSSEIRMQ